MIDRTIYKEILDSLETKPVTLITGARQVGKTTLCYKLEEEKEFSYVSLDDTRVRADAKNDPAGFLNTHPAPLIIDEIQYVPELFDEIEAKVNETKHQKINNKGMYVLTGSQIYKLMEHASDSLAGRITIINMPPLSMSEINKEEEVPFEINVNKAIKRSNNYKVSIKELFRKITTGFYPEIYENNKLKINRFYSDYLQTYLDRDVSQIINVKDKLKFENFMEVLASFTGEELVYETIAKAVSVDSKTIQSWVSVLLAGDIIHLLQPYNSFSVVKRVIKRPKIYFNDTGLACYLARLSDSEVLEHSYFAGKFVETYIVNEIRKSYLNNGQRGDFFYYRDSDGNEIDLLILKDGEVSLIECKKGETFDSSDIKAFKQLDKSKYKVKDGCIICTTSVPYSIIKGVYALPITSI